MGHGLNGGNGWGTDRSPGLLLLTINYYLLTIMASITISLEKGKASLTYGSGEIDSELREVESFHSIRVKGSIDLFLTQAPEQIVRIEAEENILPLITTEVADG